MCGEKEEEEEEEPEELGSPPHVRGKEPGRKERLMFYGITPACAGKSIETINGFNIAEDHPRMCGEKNKDVFLHKRA